MTQKHNLVQNSPKPKSVPVLGGWPPQQHPQGLCPLLLGLQDGDNFRPKINNAIPWKWIMDCAHEAFVWLSFVHNATKQDTPEEQFLASLGWASGALVSGSLGAPVASA